MSELRADLSEADQVHVTDGATGARWVFKMTTNREGRRGLDGPHGAVDDAAYPADLIRQAAIMARSEALHAGVVDY